MQFRIINKVLFPIAGILLGVVCATPAFARNEVGPREGLPGRRVSGGSRQPIEACVVGSAPLAALMPESNLTWATDASSTLWFYLPEVASSQQLEFQLYDASGKVYETALAAPQASGLVGVDLAALAQFDNAPRLRSGTAYRWTFAVVCDPDNRSEDHWVSGWVEWVENGSVRDSGAQDWALSIDEFATQAQLAPQLATLMVEWQTLISTVGLEQVIPAHLTAVPVTLEPTAPIVSSYRSRQSSED
ncbi:MAG: DUF928 domain-containing protein [Cyanobacteria bacterium J06632_22]